MSDVRYTGHVTLPTAFSGDDDDDDDNHGDSCKSDPDLPNQIRH
jgi:hypothetical protein